MTTTKLTAPGRCPPFDRYSCIMDSRTWEREGFTLHATLHHDEDTKPTDFDCYSDDQIAAWAADEWWYCGVIVTASRHGVDLGSASLWGVDCNFPDSDNSYLAEVANELAEEALHDARATIRKFTEEG